MGSWYWRAAVRLQDFKKAAEQKYHSKGQSNLVHRWTKPTIGCLKMNVDGPGSPGVVRAAKALLFAMKMAALWWVKQHRFKMFFQRGME